MDVWDAVVSGDYFKKYSPEWHERNYLQALHHRATVKMMAQHMADRLGSRVLLASAFVDGTPKFTWTPKGAASSVNGEIADILVISEVYDDKSVATHYASFLQAKNTAVANDVRRDGHGNPIGASTQKELGLYEHWPDVKFARGSRSYSVNAASRTWPFDFSHFLAIADPKLDGAANPVPAWTVKHRSDADSPFAVFSTPQAPLPCALLEWLCRTAMPSFKASMSVNIDRPKSDFDHLIADILANLLVRQQKGRRGHSGGSLIKHANARFLSFGTMASTENVFVQASADPHILKSSRAIPPSTILLPPIDQQIAGSDGSPMLVLYIVKGPEGPGPMSSSTSGRRRGG
ncbi:hypothetical protein bAD24_I11545 [Burkholderia sp. AD24]|nr:hypothetical protein bAD24_I11545 [Burkholderia sp. AD24]